MSEVETGSVASLANMQSGDLITEANRKPVSTVDELRAAVAASTRFKLLCTVRAALATSAAICTSRLRKRVSDCWR